MTGPTQPTASTAPSAASDSQLLPPAQLSQHARLDDGVTGGWCRRSRATQQRRVEGAVPDAPLQRQQVRLDRTQPRRAHRIGDTDVSAVLPVGEPPHHRPSGENARRACTAVNGHVGTTRCPIGQRAATCDHAASTPIRTQTRTHTADHSPVRGSHPWSGGSRLEPDPVLRTRSAW